MSGARTPVLILSALGMLGAGSAGLDTVRLDRLEEADVGDAHPPGWQVRSVRGVEPPHSEVVEETGHPELDRALRFEAEGQAAFFWLELSESIEPAREKVRWYWKVEDPVDGAHLREPERDDAPARFFVVFGTGGVFSTPEILFYTWGGAAEDVGTHWTYPDEDNFRIMVTRNADDPLDTWLRESRDLHEDYRRTFGGDPEAVTAVGFMIDTDDTGARAASRLGAIAKTLKRSPAPGAPIPDAGAR
ncbi:MAG: DUF3047 domain-containing protein [Gemmatimonadota bacterium]|nr:DUF3047 domain-containing protein [Gemmatimonadota bacterium]